MLFPAMKAKMTPWHEESARETYKGREFDGIGEGEDNNKHGLGSKSLEATGE